MDIGLDSEAQIKCHEMSTSAVEERKFVAKPGRL